MEKIFKEKHTKAKMTIILDIHAIFHGMYATFYLNVMYPGCDVRRWVVRAIIRIRPDARHKKLATEGLIRPVELLDPTRLGELRVFGHDGRARGLRRLYEQSGERDESEAADPGGGYAAGH